jgi:hypothetical protein
VERDPAEQRIAREADERRGGRTGDEERRVPMAVGQGALLAKAGDTIAFRSGEDRMPRALRIVLIAAAALVVAGFAFIRITKSFSPAATVSSNVASGLRVTVDYSRPQKKGRAIYGALVPFGKVWRTGANEATLISFSKDVDFGGAKVPAGKYSLFTIPAADKWTVILNSQTGQWGLSHDASKDLVQVSAAPEKHDAVTEQLTLALPPTDGGLALQIDWDQTSVRVPIKG